MAACSLALHLGGRHNEIDVLSGINGLLSNLAVLEVLHGEAQVVSIGSGLGEAALKHVGVREEDAVEGEAGSLDRMFVHFVVIK